MTSAQFRHWWTAGVFAVLVGVVAALAVTLATSPRAVDEVPAADSADAGFARDMAVHHQQAVQMSFIVRDRTDDEEVRTLAYDIINTQANQRGMLLGRLEVWGLPKTPDGPRMTWMSHPMRYEPHDGALMPGMATDTEMEALRNAEGKQAEIRYLQLMYAHHRAGVMMARNAGDIAEDPFIVRLAKGMARAQRSEMKLMADMLADRGAQPPK